MGAPERGALDRLLVRLPALATVIAGSVRRIEPGSALRRRLVNLQLARGFAAMSRSDVDVVLLSYEPDAEVWMRDMAGVGMSDCYFGHEGIRNLYADLDDAFDDWRWTASAVADGGDRIAIGGAFVGYGRTSGVKTALDNGGTAVKLSSRGLVTWQEWFVEDGWERALAALGLSAQGRIDATG